MGLCVIVACVIKDRSKGESIAMSVSLQLGLSSYKLKRLLFQKFWIEEWLIYPTGWLKKIVFFNYMINLFRYHSAHLNVLSYKNDACQCYCVVLCNDNICNCSLNFFVVTQLVKWLITEVIVIFIIFPSGCLMNETMTTKINCREELKPAFTACQAKFLSAALDSWPRALHFTFMQHNKAI